MYSEEQMKIIMEDDALKALYAELLKVDMQFRIKDAQIKYDNLVIPDKEEKKAKKLPLENF